MGTVNPNPTPPKESVTAPQRELQLQVPRAREKHPELHDSDGNQR